MARLSTAELERLKKSVSLMTLLESEGYRLKKQGKDYVMLCPFHQEKTPSFSVSPSKNCYHCFGCGASGSVLDYVMQSQCISMGKAIAYLQAFSGSVPAVPVVAAVTPPPSAQSLTTDDNQALLTQVVDYYHHQLLESVEAKAWLEKRGLTDPELITQFKLGYAGTYGVSTLAGSRKQRSGKELRGRLQSLGVLRETTGQDHFRGCFIVPIIGLSDSCSLASRDRVFQLYGRRIAPDSALKKGSPKHLYLPAPLVGVWNESALVSGEAVILCEALIDAMSIWCAGYCQHSCYKSLKRS